MKTKALTFNVTRRVPELIPPAKATPHEMKYLSPIDELESLRYQAPVVSFYPRSESAAHAKDPATVIRKAIAEALVYYYPLAGRLRGNSKPQLVVDCTGEGIIFTEADADVSIDEFGDPICPPIPGLSELLSDVSGSGGILGCPLVLAQVTRLKCGGFVFATRFNHALCDGVGMVQFLTAVSELARGWPTPSVHPLWHRHLIRSRRPQENTVARREFDHTITPLFEQDELMIQRSFIFDDYQVSSLRRHHIGKSSSCSTFELIAAIIWRARTMALKFDPREEVRLLVAVDIRNKFNPPIPIGYYGNVIAAPAAVTTAGQLKANPISYTVELIKSAKASVNADNLINVPCVVGARSFTLSDVRRLGVQYVDYGWGKPEYGGFPIWGGGQAPYASFLIPVKSPNGENRSVVPMSLPQPAMVSFAEELDHMMNNDALHSSL
uniref:Benzyl alcohol O-benzoyltransferase n=1 Tax=Kalanchoe fedtschenkoi TaxID=63787 RepID=A0A7N0RIL6_KALFE